MRRSAILLALTCGWGFVLALCVSWPAEGAGGLNNALMNVPSALTLSPGQLEVSPTWQTSFINHRFTAQGLRQELPQTTYFSQLEVRVTFGLPAWWEVGFAVQGNWRYTTSHSVEAERVSLGLRRDLVRLGSVWALNLFVGVKLPVRATAPEVIPDIGLAQSYKPWSWLQIDLSLAVLCETSQPLKPGFRYDVGVGAFFYKEIWQAVVEWSHEWSWGHDVVSRGVLGLGLNWYFAPGATLTVGALFDAVGYNSEQGVVAYLAYAHVWSIATPRQ